jgi:3-dehydroquinate synthase
MLLAADLSQRMGWLNETDVLRIDNIIDKACLPTRAPAKISTDKFLELMARDKKALHGTIRLVLLKRIGQAVISSDYDPQLLKTTLDEHHAM